MDRSTKKKFSSHERIAKRELHKFKRSGTYRRSIAKCRKDFEEKVRRNLESAGGHRDSSNSDNDANGPLSDVSIASDNDELSGSDSDIIPAIDVVGCDAILPLTSDGIHH